MSERDVAGAGALEGRDRVDTSEVPAVRGEEKKEPCVLKRSREYLLCPRANRGASSDKNSRRQNPNWGKRSSTVAWDVFISWSGEKKRCRCLETK